MTRALLLLLAVLPLIAPAQAAWQLPPEHAGYAYTDLQIWIMSEEHIEDLWAEQNLLVLSGAYTNREISVPPMLAPLEAFLADPRLQELRTVMLRYSRLLGYKDIALRYVDEDGRIVYGMMAG